MKNIVIIDRDTEREIKIIIRKPESESKATTPDESKMVIINDISATTEGLLTLVKIANDSGYMDADKSAKLIISYFEKFLDEEK